MGATLESVCHSMCIFLVLLKWSKSSVTIHCNVQIMNTPSTQVVVSENHSPVKGSWAFWRNSLFLGWARKSTRKARDILLG